MNKGHLEVICGPMYATKTQELINRIRRANYANQTAIVFKPRIDNRYDENDIVSHDGLKEKAHPIKNPVSALNIYDEYGPFDIVAFDEAQFFDIRILDVVNEFINIGVRVIVAGLDQDFRGCGFNSMPELLARCKYFVKLTAVCVKCGQDATMTQRLIDGKPAPLEGDIIMVGGKDSYEARCSECWEEGVG